MSALPMRLASSSLASWLQSQMVTTRVGAREGSAGGLTGRTKALPLPLEGQAGLALE